MGKNWFWYTGCIDSTAIRILHRKMGGGKRVRKQGKGEDGTADSDIG
jgi:hypothetical protein